MIAEQPFRDVFHLTAHAEHVVRERGIELGWIASALLSADLREPDRTDPELGHALKVIKEREGRVLRVVYNATREPPLIVTVYFDRAMRGKL